MQQISTEKKPFSTLSALTRAATASARAAEIEKETGAYSRTIPISQVRVKPQVRRDFSDIADFAERLKQVGHVHTSILVREIEGESAYELIAGERRLRASTLNEWQEIPAKIFPANTPDLKIRKFQVSENVDRKSFTLHETATGLAADVERYGRDEAALIWTGPSGKQRSASWMSKHLRFQKYGPLTRELFDANLFEDIEAANKLDDIEAISADVAAELAAEMKAGRKIGRLTLEARLSALKEANRPQAPQAANQQLLSEQPLAPISSGNGNAEVAAPASSPATSSANVPQWATQLTSAASHAGETATASRVDESPATPGASGASKSSSAGVPASEESPDAAPTLPVMPTTAAPVRVKQQHAANADPKSTVLWRIQEIYEVGTTSIGRLRALQRDLSAAGVGEEAADWRLWIAFVDIVASAMVGVGSETGGKILDRFVTELNSRGPLELLNRLHPTGKAGVLPDDFGYDTDREIHPLAPGDWSL